jgi:hypothetical protein
VPPLQRQPPDDAFLFPGVNEGRPWRDHDCRNWRKRHFQPAAEAAGLTQARPYDLRHSFASLMLHEGRVGVVDLASELGHSPTMTLNTYGHVIAELREAPWTSATEAIMRFRGSAPETPPNDETRPSVNQRIAPSQPSRRPDSNRRPLHYEALGILHSDLALQRAFRPAIPYAVRALFRSYSAWAKELTHPRDGLARG